MVCPTYNRAPEYLHLLEEAVQSYLFCAAHFQGPSELLILNDTPKQELFCSAPGVRVVNLPARVPTLGEKRNFLCQEARFNILLPQDDDDISLPHRISQAAGILEEFSYFIPKRYFFMPGDEVEVPPTFGVSHNCSAFTRAAFMASGGYPASSGDEDAVMDARLRQALPRGVLDGSWIPPETWSYIYRWGVGPNHLSGRSDLQANYARIGRRPITPGRFEIVPRWRVDYCDLVKQALKKRRTR